MSRTPTDADRLLDLARRMEIPLDDAIREVIGRMGSNVDDAPGAVTPGTEVEVLNRYQAHWVTGFEIDTVQDDSCRVRRRSDNTVLPAVFTLNEVRPRR